MGLPAIELNTAPSHLRDLVEAAAERGEVILTDGGQAVAKIVSLKQRREPRRPGSARGLIHMADDFDAMPADLEEYF